MDNCPIDFNCEVRSINFPPTAMKCRLLLLSVYLSVNGRGMRSQHFVCLFIYYFHAGNGISLAVPGCQRSGQVRALPQPRARRGCSSGSHRQVSPGAPESGGPRAAAVTAPGAATSERPLPAPEPARHTGCTLSSGPGVIWMMVVAKRVN